MTLVNATSEIQHTSKLHEWIGPLSSAWLFYCPGCKENHIFTVMQDGTGWKFEGDVNNPTFTPSLLYPSKAIRCHLFVTKGKIHYCDDCAHDLKNQIVDMVDVEPLS